MVLLTNGFTVWGGPAAPTLRVSSRPYRAHTRNQKIKIGIFCQICKNITSFLIFTLINRLIMTLHCATAKNSPSKLEGAPEGEGVCLCCKGYSLQRGVL